MSRWNGLILIIMTASLNALITTGNMTVHQGSSDSYTLPTERPTSATQAMGIISSGNGTDPAQLGWIERSLSPITFRGIDGGQVDGLDIGTVNQGESVTFDEVAGDLDNVSCANASVSSCVVDTGDGSDVTLKFCLIVGTDSSQSKAELVVGGATYLIIGASSSFYDNNMYNCLIIPAADGDTFDLIGYDIRDNAGTYSTPGKSGQMTIEELK